MHRLPLEGPPTSAGTREPLDLTQEPVEGGQECADPSDLSKEQCFILEMQR